MDWRRTAIQDGLVFYGFQACQVYALEKGSVQAIKRIREGERAPNKVALPTFLVVFRVRSLRVTLIKQDHKKYWGQRGELNGAERKEAKEKSI